MSQQMLNVFTHCSHRSSQQLAVPTLSLPGSLPPGCKYSPPDMLGLDVQRVSVTADI